MPGLLHYDEAAIGDRRSHETGLLDRGEHIVRPMDDEGGHGDGGQEGREIAAELDVE